MLRLIAIGSPIRLLGRGVAALVDSTATPGDHTVSFQAGRRPGGIYLYRLTAGAAVRVGTMVVLK